MTSIGHGSDDGRYHPLAGRRCVASLRGDIDISKDTLDVHRLSDGASSQFFNSKSGFLDLARWLAKTQIARIVYEPTGVYHRDFEMALGSRFPMVKVNPLQARRFAQAIGVRAKTDQIDARMLALMGSGFTLSPQALISQKQRELKEFQLLRQALVKERTRHSNRSKFLLLAISKRQAMTRLSLLTRQHEEIDAKIQQLLSNSLQTMRAREILCSIPGLSKVSAAALLIEMPELGALSNKQTASLAGLAPMVR